LKFVNLIALLALCTAPIWAEDDHDHDGDEHEALGQSSQASHPEGKTPKGPRKTIPFENGKIDTSCQVSPVGLANFANGESYDYNNLVTYLSNPNCVAVSPQISSAAIKYGINFSKIAPYQLESYSKNALKDALGSQDSFYQVFGKKLPSLLRSNPLSSKELLPLVGQLSVLSIPAGRTGLVELMTQETIQAADKMNLGNQEEVAALLARTLVRLGANESNLVGELARNVEESAVLSQADSLAKFFKGLGQAAGSDSSLVPAFNLSASALTRGVQRGSKLYDAKQLQAMQKAVFEAVKTALGSSSLDPGANDLNEGLYALLQGKSLNDSSLRAFWRDIAKLLSRSENQTALADAVALSLSAKVVYLNHTDRELLLDAAKKYPQIAISVQEKVLESLGELRADLKRSRIRAAQYNSTLNLFYRPWISRLVELDTDSVDIAWLKEIFSYGLLSDQDIESKFPKHFLVYLDRRHNALKKPLPDDDFATTSQVMTENFASVWAMSRVYLPSLMRWVKKHEE